MPGVRGRPQQRGLERRRAILEAATELYRERGEAGTSTAAIARRAGVAASTVYHHFPSKGDLLRGVLEDRDVRLGSELRLRRLADLRAVAVENETHPELAALHTLLLVESLRPGAVAHDWFSTRSNAVSSGLALLVERERPDLDATVTGQVIAAFMEGAQALWQLDPSSFSLSVLYAAFLGLLEPNSQTA